MFYVYQVTGPSGAYIGKTNDVARRWRRHLGDAKKGSSVRFHRAVSKYGPERFSIEVIAQSRLESDCFLVESAVIQQERLRGVRLYNLTDGGEGVSGVIVSPETCAKISAAKKGVPGRKITAEERRARSEKLRGRPGKPLSEATKAKLRAHNLGKSLSAEAREKISASLRGRPVSDETRARMCAAQRGHAVSASTRERMRQVRTGTKATETTRARMQESQLVRCALVRFFASVREIARG